MTDDLVDSRLSGDSLRRLPSIAGQHDDARTLAFQCRHDVGSIRPQGVCDREGSHGATADGYEDGGLAAGCPLLRHRT
jgi:hypothetical protein